MGRHSGSFCRSVGDGEIKCFVTSTTQDRRTAVERREVPQRRLRRGHYLQVRPISSAVGPAYKQCRKPAYVIWSKVIWLNVFDKGSITHIPSPNLAHISITHSNLTTS
jgi:hypothetical protein